MATANSGSQRIGWKFSTPLQADYLNTFIAGFSSQGLLTRPKMTPQRTSSGADVTIEPFSLLICPEDTTSNAPVDENNEPVYQKLVKVTTTTNIKLSIFKETIALGFEYSFSTPEGSTQSQWYGEVKALSPSELSEFKGIIIATCQNYQSSSGIFYSVKTNGADISDFLLKKEGWNPMKWLSVISPRRITDGVYYNKLEVRSHNNSYKGYINGNSGLNIHQNLVYILDTRVDPSSNPNGTRGFMPHKYNAFKLQSDGFALAEHDNDLPLTKTSGGIFALVDAGTTNQELDGSSFTNNLNIKPVESEDINIYYDNSTLFIR